MTTIRAARVDEVERLREIEVAAGQVFVDVGMPEIAADDPKPAAELARYVDDSRAWVAVAADDDPIAYILVDVVDGLAHVEQVSVHPGHARRGIGRLLLDQVAGWAIAHDRRALTLSTFRDVPWNAPYYERCGFRALPDDELGPELRTLLAHEADLGLDPTKRVAMRRDLD